MNFIAYTLSCTYLNGAYWWATIITAISIVRENLHYEEKHSNIRGKRVSFLFRWYNDKFTLPGLRIDLEFYYYLNKMSHIRNSNSCFYVSCRYPTVMSRMSFILHLQTKNYFGRTLNFLYTQYAVITVSNDVWTAKPMYV